MPLMEMSPNIKEAETASRKRCHDEFSGDLIKAGHHTTHDVSSKIIQTTEDCLPDIDIDSNLSSPLSSPALTAAGSSTPTRISPCPLTPTKTSSNSPNSKHKDSPSHTKLSTAMANPAKRKRLTAADKEAKEKELLEKKKEREEKASARAAERAKQEEEKAARLKEREEKRKKKEEEDKAKAQQRDEKKRKKEEEQQRIQDEKDKKARSQKTLNNFFKAPSTPKKPLVEAAIKNESPSADAAASSATTKQTITPYQKMFKPFFVKESMRMAASSRLDDETRTAKSQLLDECIASSGQGPDQAFPFEPTQLLGIPTAGVKRGRQYHPVKHIMELVYKQIASSSNAGTDETNKIIHQAKEKLAKVPVKVIAFSQDVRPPYYGTITYQPYALGPQLMRSLARKPVDRVLPLEYDFDSEAEWQEEEGEDVDMDDDEEELDDEDDMDGFLDDSEDAGLSRRIFANAIEPESTGICFEDINRVGPSGSAYGHKMEFMHESIERDAEIDPWSAEYWEPEPKTKTSKAPVAKTPTAKTTASNDKTSSKMPPPPAPANAFEALTNNTNGSNTGAAAAAAPSKMVKAELMDELKQTVLDNKALSKIGIVDFVFHKLKGKASRAEVTNTIAHVAERTGTGRAKQWSLKEGHELVS